MDGQGPTLLGKQRAADDGIVQKDLRFGKAFAGHNDGLPMFSNTPLGMAHFKALRIHLTQHPPDQIGMGAQAYGATATSATRISATDPTFQRW